MIFVTTPELVRPPSHQVHQHPNFIPSILRNFAFPLNSARNFPRVNLYFYDFSHCIKQHPWAFYDFNTSCREIGLGLFVFFTWHMRGNFTYLMDIHANVERIFFLHTCKRLLCLSKSQSIFTWVTNYIQRFCDKSIFFVHASQNRWRVKVWSYTFEYLHYSNNIEWFGSWIRGPHHKRKLNLLISIKGHFSLKL